MPKAPILKFGEYQLTDGLVWPAIPEKLNLYTFATNPSAEQAAQVPTKLGLGLNLPLSNERVLTFINITRASNLGYWLMDRNSGRIEFQSYGVHQPQGTSPEATPTQVAEAFLRENSLWDETLCATTTYQRLGQPFTYIYTTQETGVVTKPIYVSGASPFLFFYQNGKRVDYWTAGIDITLPQATTYHETFADPLYYEYNSQMVDFSLPQEGVVVETAKIEPWVQEKLSLWLGLTASEREFLVKDLQKIIRKVDKNYVRVGISSEAELNNKLALTIFPQPQNLVRIHLLVTPLESKKALSSPKVEKIARDGFTVVEIGARKM